MSLQLTEFASQLHLQGEILKEAPPPTIEGDSHEPPAN